MKVFILCFISISLIGLYPDSDDSQHEDNNIFHWIGILERSESVDERVEAAFELGKIESLPHKAVSSLIGAISDDFYKVKMAALKSIDRQTHDLKPFLPIIQRYIHDDVMTGDSDWGPLALLLRCGDDGFNSFVKYLSDFDVKQSALKAVIYGGCPDPGLLVPILLEKIDDYYLDYTWNVIRALDSIGEPSVPYLNGLLDQENDRLRLIACWALWRLGPKARDSKELLVEKLQDRSLEVRMAAVKALEHVDRDSYDHLLTALNNENALVRLRAVWAIGNRKKDRALVKDALMGALSDRSEDVRMGAVRNLGMLGSDALDTVPYLISHLNDEDKWVRVAAINAIGEIGSLGPSSKSALSELLNSSDPDIRVEASNVLEKHEKNVR